MTETIDDLVNLLAKIRADLRTLKARWQVLVLHESRTRKRLHMRYYLDRPEKAKMQVDFHKVWRKATPAGRAYEKRRNERRKEARRLAREQRK